MALDDEIRPDLRMLPRLIEVAEEIGDWPRVEQLREWLADANAEPARGKPVSDNTPDEATADRPTEEDCQRADPDETIITVSLGCLPQDIRYRLYDYLVTDLSQLSCWHPRLLNKILSVHQVRVVDRVCAAIGFPIGSAVDLLRELPARSPFGLDLRDGRRPEDVTDVLRRLAYGELTFRDASVVLGSRGLAKVRPHQRACSVVQRHAKMFASYRRMALMDQHHGESWLIDAGLREFSGAKPGWGLWIKVSATEERVKQILDAVPKPVYGGIASRGCPMVLIGGR